MLIVGASVGDRCTVLTVPITFGYYRRTDAAPNDAQGAVSLNCNTGRQIFIRMDDGQNPGPGSSNPNPVRRMTDGLAHFLNYNLYRNAARTQVWGNTGGSDITVNGPYPMLIPVYGRIPALQSPQPGPYSDTVTVSINF